MVLDRYPFLTHGTFGVPTLMTLVGDDRVLGLTLVTAFDRLTLSADHMMLHTMGTIKFAVTRSAILGGADAPHIIRTIKAPTRGAASPLTSVMGSIIGVEPSFTVQAIIGAIHERGKGRAAVKMIIGLE